MRLKGYWVSEVAGEIQVTTGEFDETDLSDHSDWKEAWQNDDPNSPHGYLDPLAMLKDIASRILQTKNDKKIQTKIPDIYTGKSFQVRDIQELAQLISIITNQYFECNAEAVFQIEYENICLSEIRQVVDLDDHICLFFTDEIDLSNVKKLILSKTEKEIQEFVNFMSDDLTEDGQLMDLLHETIYEYKFDIAKKMDESRGGVDSIIDNMFVKFVSVVFKIGDRTFSVSA